MVVAVRYFMHRTLLTCLLQILFCKVPATAATDDDNMYHAPPITQRDKSSIFDIESRPRFSFSHLRRKDASTSSLSSSNSKLSMTSTSYTQPPPPLTNQTKQTINNSYERHAVPRTIEELKQEKRNKIKRIQRRRELAREKIMRQMIENPHEFTTGRAEKMSQEDIQSLVNDLEKQDPQLLQRPENRWLWGLGGSAGSKQSNIADPFVYWDKWSQAFRMLGVYLECKSSQSQWMYDGGGNGKGNNKNGDNYGCKRWVLWAAYVNPNYQGYGINEYVVNWGGDDDYYGRFSQYSSGGCQRNDNNGGQYKCYNQQTSENKKKNNKNAQDEPMSKLDCHYLDTEWLIMGVYRENFYDYFEQITKHLWYYNSYEYKIASSGLQLINDKCEGVGIDKYGNYLYRAPKPVQGGGFILGFYTDDTCMTPSEEDATDYGYGYSEDSTLELFNQIFEEFKYCTLCIDYPSYQDGYFNGDGYDEEDLINQCWKFYSHDTYECDASCLASADAQGTVNAFIYGNRLYGTKWDGSASGSTKKSTSHSYSHSLFSSNDVSFKEHFQTNIFLFACCVIFALALNMFYNAEGNYFGDYFDGKDSGKKSRLQALLDRNDKDQPQKATNRGSILNALKMQAKSVSTRKKQLPPVVKVQNESKQRTNIIVVGGNKRLSQSEPSSSNIKSNKVPKVFIKSKNANDGNTNHESHGDYAPPKRRLNHDDASKAAIAILSKQRIKTYTK